METDNISLVDLAHVGAKRGPRAECEPSARPLYLEARELERIVLHVLACCRLACGLERVREDDACGTGSYVP